MCSFPLLEDFALLVFDSGNEIDGYTIPLISPRLTGSLELRSTVGGIGPITRRLLELPNGLKFTKFVLVFIDGVDPEAATGLVSQCSNTLESLDVTGYSPGIFPPVPVPDRNLTIA